MLKDRLTNEALKKQFKNNFDLANYVINVGRYFIQSGREMSLNDLLKEVERNPHQYTEEAIKLLEQEES